MNRDQKAAAIAEIASHIDESEAIFAVDYRGITVAQVAELRATLRQSDATFKVVKNSLTERAADQVGAESLKEFLAGPTALTFVRGDVATAAKVVADYARTTQLLPFKGGLMEGNTLDIEQIRTLSKLPTREVLYSQLVGVVASPIGGLVRTLNALIGGLAVALGQVNAKKESGEIPAGAAPAAGAAETAEAPVVEESAAEKPAVDEPAAEASAEEPAGEAEAPAEEAPVAEAAEEPAAEEPAAEELPDEIAKAEETAVEAPPAAETASSPEGEPETDEPAQTDDNQADVSAEDQPEDAETTKED
jgi:large subunit ribosomal protein L10